MFRPVSLPAFLVLTLALLAAFVTPARAQNHLLFCNRPEKIRIPGTHADTMLRAGRTYTIFFHYRNMTGSRDNLVVALSGDAKKPLRFDARKGFGDPQHDPTLAGRQAMARFLSAPEKEYTGRKGGAHFLMAVGNRATASGVMTVRAVTDARLRIYWRHNKWSVPGARVVGIDTPRREVAVNLTRMQRSESYRIGVPDAGMSKHLDGTYGMLYSFKVDAPLGSRVRVSFSPRGGKAGLVGSINGSLRQTRIIPATRWKVFCEAVVGKHGLTLTTSPFGGVFYPVELMFQLVTAQTSAKESGRLNRKYGRIVYEGKPHENRSDRSQPQSHLSGAQPLSTLGLGSERLFSVVSH